MTKAIYPGSFDPITHGHLDIIRRIQPLFSELVVVVANSHRKQYLFSLSERVQLIRENLSVLAKDAGAQPAVQVDQCDGLIVDYAVANKAQVIVRGLRAVADFEYELAMANMNKKLKDSIETMIVFTRPEFSFVASHMVKEVALYNGNLNALVPDNVARALRERMRRKD